MKELIESMTKGWLEWTNDSGVIVRWEYRCWRQEESGEDEEIRKTSKEVFDAVGQYEEEMWIGGRTQVGLATALLSMDRMNAVEVVNPYYGGGVVVYKDWP